MKKDLSKAKGGNARAESLSKEKLVDIAKKGADARWSDDIEIAKRAGTLEIGDVVIPCAVMADGTRLLSERAIAKAFGAKRGGSHWKRMKENPDGAYLPVFLSAKNIRANVDKELAAKLGRRRFYRAKRGGAAGYGVEASLYPKILNLYLRLRDELVLTDSQLPLAAQAEILIRGLAEIGIIALVDEATGFDQDKKKDEYRELFKAFIQEQVGEYQKEFPKLFTDNLYKMYGITQKTPGKHPQFFGKFTRKYIYEPLAESKGAILDMLDEKNPVVTAKGGRKFKMFQFLNEELGKPAFRAHLWQVVGIQGSSRNKAEFDRNFNRAFNRKGTQGDLFPDDDE